MAEEVQPGPATVPPVELGDDRVEGTVLAALEADFIAGAADLLVADDDLRGLRPDVPLVTIQVLSRLVRLIHCCRDRSDIFGRMIEKDFATEQRTDRLVFRLVGLRRRYLSARFLAPILQHRPTCGSLYGTRWHRLYQSGHVLR